MCALSVEDVSSRQGFQARNIGPARNTTTATRREEIAFLDREIPLRGASHAEVRSYTVEIPMRYAMCLANLVDGRKVGFRDNRHFLGWSGWEAKRSYLFARSAQYIEIRTNPERQDTRGVPGRVHSIVVGLPVAESPFAKLCADANRSNTGETFARPNNERKFIATDGDQIILPRGCLMQIELFCC